jgi:tetratricopeptide (TPR) repeat protein
MGAVLVALVCAGAASCCAQEDAAALKARADFETAYKAALEAIAKEDWEAAEVTLAAAQKALGDRPHADKELAERLLAKARKIVGEKREVTTTLKAADELLRLRQWAEAESLYKRARDLGADKTAVEKGLAAAQAGLKQEGYKTALAEGFARLGAKDWENAERAFLKALEYEPNDPAASNALRDARAGKGAATPAAPSTVPVTPPATVTTPATPAVAVQESIELPTPETLDRDQWTKGAGSSCFWAGELLHLEEGDEKFTRMLKGNFAASIAIEARMDHRSMIYLDLRPDKDAGGKAPTIRGYGSKEASPPYLLAGKDMVGRGKRQPPREQITLSFRRTGKQIEFYCDGEKIAETWEVPEGTPLWLWVCGKGTMNGAKVAGGQ